MNKDRRDEVEVDKGQEATHLYANKTNDKGNCCISFLGSL